MGLRSTGARLGSTVGVDPTVGVVFVKAEAPGFPVAVGWSAAAITPASTGKAALAVSLPFGLDTGASLGEQPAVRISSNAAMSGVEHFTRWRIDRNRVSQRRVPRRALDRRMTFASLTVRGLCPLRPLVRGDRAPDTRGGS